LLDGELVALDAHGRSRFQLLQNAEREPARLLYCVFDLLYLDGKDLRKRPLLERKAALEQILPKSPLLLYSAHVTGAGIKAFNRAKRLGEEGVMAKLATGRYRAGERTREWLKVKASQEQEVVIVGFTAPRRSRKYFGALVLAVREGKGWTYVGRAGTGVGVRGGGDGGSGVAGSALQVLLDIQRIVLILWNPQPPGRSPCDCLIVCLLARH